MQHEIRRKFAIGMIWLTCMICLIMPAVAVYNFDGIQLENVRHETINGGIYVDGGHGLSASPYTQTFTNVPSGNIKYAKLYVGVWGGNADYTGTIETTINDENLGIKSLDGQEDTNPEVYVSGYGVYWVPYDVKNKINPGSNTVIATTGGDIDGRIYGIVLVAVYEDPSQPQIEYWINEGNENPNDKTPKDTATTFFDGNINTSNVGSAKIWTSYIASKSSDSDTLSMNGNLISTEASKADEGSYFDLDEWDVKDYIASSGNTLEFNRGSGTSLHPVSAILILSPEASTSGQPDLTVVNITFSKLYNGTANTINAEIANIGLEDVESFNITFYVDGDVTDVQEISSLAAGFNTNVSFTWDTESVGSYLFEIIVDSEDIISEIDEDNNENSIAAEVVEKNGYFGDNLLEVYEHNKIYGDVLYTIGNSTYRGEMVNGDVYSVQSEINIPTSDSEVKLARLYTYWSWSHSGDNGVYPDMKVNFDGNTIQIDDEYTDRKGFGNYDYPSGTYAYDVTELVKSTKNYTTTVENVGDAASFGIYGVGILVVFEDESLPEVEYWIGEGADILSSTSSNEVTPEQATSYVIFNGSIDVSSVKNATLLTIVLGADKGDVEKNKLFFNSNNWTGALDAPSTQQQIAIDYREVGSYVRATNNKVGIQDLGDYMVASNAILVLKTEQKVPDLGSADISEGVLTEIGIKTTPDSLYGAASGSLFFGIYDDLGQIAAKRTASEVTIYSIDKIIDPSDWDWSKIKTTDVEWDLTLVDLMEDSSMVYITTECYYDSNSNGKKDDDEERVYKTITWDDGTFAIQMEGGSYNIYASY